MMPGGFNLALDTTTPAFVVKVGDYPFHHGSLGIIRSLGRLGIPIYGVHEHRFAPAAVSRYLHGRFIWQAEGERADRFLEGMATAGHRLGRPAILIPTDDLAAVLIAENAAVLRQWFLFPHPPASLPRTVASKKGLYWLCKELGVPCPEASFPTSRQEVQEFAARASFPVVVKGIESWRLPPEAGFKSTTIVQTREQLLDLYRRLDGRSGENLMLQEYIPRDCAQDWIFHGYCDAASQCLVSFTGVKLRSYPAHAGPTSLGRSVDNDVLRQDTERLMRAISYRGIMDLDYRLDLRDGEYKLLDFNPRVGAQFRLFEDESGIDVVRALHLDLTGREIPRRRQAEGRVFFVENSDLLASLAYRRNQELTLRAWLSSLQGTHREPAWFARDDLAPFALMWVRFLLRAVQRALRLQGRYRRPSRIPRYLPGPARRKGHGLQRRKYRRT